MARESKGGQYGTMQFSVSVLTAGEYMSEGDKGVLSSVLVTVL